MTRYLVSVAVLMLATGASIETLPQKAVYEQEISVRYETPPDTLDDMMAAAQTVVIATHTGAVRFVDKSSVPSAARMMTGHTLRVHRILKDVPAGNVAAGREIEVFIPGGDKEYDDHIVRSVDRHVTTPRAKRTYIIFLARNPATWEQGLQWGPNSIFDITTGRLATISAWTSSQKFDGMTLDEFLAATPSRGK